MPDWFKKNARLFLAIFAAIYPPLVGALWVFCGPRYLPESDTMRSLLGAAMFVSWWFLPSMLAWFLPDRPSNGMIIGCTTAYVFAATLVGSWFWWFLPRAIGIIHGD